MSVPRRQPNRIASGGLVDRTKPVSFTFDGKSCGGFAGDTLASALIASGAQLVGRSFKYHRPRGLLSAGPEEPNALVEVGHGARREPNTRATTLELYDGLEATSQNRWPSLAFDVRAVNGVLSPFIGAGFYYKTFMWPAKFWEKVYEPLIRRAAGLGRASEGEDPDTYEKAFAHCDVLVVGAGPAGLMAALTAGRAGARVVLVTEDFALGGRLLSDRHEIADTSGVSWVATVADELASMPDVRVFSRTTVFGVYDGGTYGAVERVNDHVTVPPLHQPRHRLWRIFAKRCVLAAGAIERPLVFGNNDRPGIMLAGAARTYVNRFAALPGRRVVVFTSCDDGWRTARDMVDAGATLEAVIDSRPVTAQGFEAGLIGTDAYFLYGASVRNTTGLHGVTGAVVREANGSELYIRCDTVLMSNGWSPTVHLTCHLGGKPVWRDTAAAFVPGSLPAGMSVAGAASGEFALAQCLAAGAREGAKAATDVGFPARPAPQPTADDEPAAVTPLWYVKDSFGKAFVDFQNDATAKDVGLAVREGYRAPELLKRYTTLGMATDQGKTANVNALGLLALERGSSLAAVGTTAYRPPYTPVSIGALGGHHRGPEFRPTRKTAAHDWAVETHAVMRTVGPWLRTGWFQHPDEPDWLASTNREVIATRERVGVCDVSTLGKIDIQGGDSGTFLDRVYCNTFSTLPVGKARYGLMLREDGFVFDDGTTSRLGREHFLMTTTTAKASEVMRHLEFCHQCLWPELDVQMASVSEQWAQYSIAGPRARDVIAKLVDRQHDIANAAFPYMAARDITVLGGTVARLFRISFSGELAYEIAVPARYGDGMIRAIMSAGAEYGMTPYGLEALSVMRIEKGHVAGGELNGQTTARDLGLTKMMSTKKDYIGRVLAERPALVATDRWRLVGIKPLTADERPRGGAHFIGVGQAAKLANDEGYVTSVAFSPSMQTWLGLGLLKRGHERHGERIRAVDLLRGSDVECVVCDPVFYDPEGRRLHE